MIKYFRRSNELRKNKANKKKRKNYKRTNSCKMHLHKVKRILIMKRLRISSHKKIKF